MKFCTDCQVDVAPSVTLDGRQAILVCPRCAHRLPDENTVTAAEVEPPPQRALPGIDVAPRGVTISVKTKSLPPTPSPAEPINALRAIRARRRWLATEIKRLRALEREDVELAAAESAVTAARRVDNVSPIRRSSS